MSRSTPIAKTITPGRGTAVVGPSGVALVDEGPDHPLVAGIASALGAGGGFPEFLAELAAHGLDSLPSLGAVFGDERGIRAISRGGVRLGVVAAMPLDPSVLSGTTLLTWREVGIPAARSWELFLADVGPSGDPPSGAPGVPGSCAAERIAGEVGVAVGDPPTGPPGGATAVASELDPTVLEPAPATQQLPQLPGPPGAPPIGAPPPAIVPPPSPMSGDATEIVSPFAPQGAWVSPMPPSHVVPPPPGGVAGSSWASASTVEQRLGGDGRPLVAQQFCDAGHPNPPEAESCRSCGGRISDPTLHELPRPDLGRLVFYSGRSIGLERPVIIGRNPPDGLEVGGEQAMPFRVPDPDAVLSRQHLEVRLEGWDVVLVDKRSRNSTMIVKPGDPPERLLPAVPTEIPLGTRVVLADVAEFVYEPPAP